MSTSYEFESYLSIEERVANYFENSANGYNLHNENWDWETPDGEPKLIKTVNLHKPWFVVEFTMTNRFENYHAHVDTSARDCDGGHGYSYIAPSQGIKGIEEEWDFEAHMMRSLVETHNPGAQLVITVDGFETNAPNEEGYSAASVRYCYDWDCEAPKNAVYDQFAQAAGY